MISLQTILVPTDLSAHAKRAVQYAVDLGKPRGSLILLFHVFEVPVPVNYGPGIVPPPPVTSEMRDAVRKRLGELRNELIPADMNVEFVVREGRPSQEICAAARELRADLIVMPTHGYTGLKHILLGSTTERVIRKAPCPVLVVRSEEREAARA